MLIDFHTHAFPDAIAGKALHQLVANTKPYEAIYGPAVPHTEATLDSLLTSSRRAGLDVSLVLPIATSTKPSHTLNDFAAQADQRAGLRSFGSVHPRSPACRQEIERVRELGLRGIKLHPEYQGCFVDEPAVTEAVRTAASCGLWVVLHAGEDIGMPPPVHCTPERVVRLRRAVPEAKLVLAHMGGYRMWQAVLDSAADMAVWIDTSFCIPNHPDQHALFARIIRAVGCGHVLFGTDSPWADQQETLMATQAFLEDQGFSAGERAAILGGNAAAILGLAD